MLSINLGLGEACCKASYSKCIATQVYRISSLCKGLVLAATAQGTKTETSQHVEFLGLFEFAQVGTCKAFESFPCVNWNP